MADANYPSLLRRLVVITYDSLLVVAVCIAYGGIYILINKLLFQASSDHAEGIVFQIGFLLTIFGFFCFFWRRGGQTTGMRAWRMKIFNKDNKSPSLKQCLMRFLLAPIGWLLFPTAYFNRNKQLLHELWSSTEIRLISGDE